MLKFPRQKKESFPGIYYKKEGLVLTGRDNSLFFIDYEGRILYAFIDNKGFRLGFSGEVIEKGRINGKKYIKRYNSGLFLKKIYERASYILKDEYFNKKKKEIEDFLKRGFLNFERSFKNFKEVYGRIPIVPPDMYLSLYIQITKGCSYNKCTFCNFYKGERFRILERDEFISHIEKVRTLFGKGISARRGIFLGDADALLLRSDKIFEYLEIIKDNFKERNLNRISSFLDVWTGKKRSFEFWEKIKDFSLSKVYIGLESGSKEVLKKLNKPFDPDEFILLTENLKRAGVSIGVIVLLGIAGELEEEHKEETLRLLKDVPFDSSDILYLSPYYPFEGTFPCEVSEEEIKREIEFFSSLDLKKRPKIAVYDIREFVY